LNTLPWLLDVVENGVRLPFERKPPRMILQNTKNVLEADMVPVIRGIISEYIEAGFVQQVDWVPYCILPLQVKVTGIKTALIYDMSPLNVFIEKSKFTLEGWEIMFEYCKGKQYAVKFDLKKYYHEIDIHKDFRTYFGFKYQMQDGADLVTFVWNTMPYGYTRSPYIARCLMKPLIAKWRKMGMKMVVFYDDGMAVDDDFEKLHLHASIMHSDLINAGLVPGVGKCIWSPVQAVDWNGLSFDFKKGGISILPHRIEKTLGNISNLIEQWPKVTYRQIARLEGQIISMNPVFNGVEQLRSRMLQTFVNIRHYKNKSWEAYIQADYEPLFDLALAEMKRLQNMLADANFRPFREATPSALAWVDASEVAVAGIAV
jgi:hypothetical protein